jgi:hypothetical protein
MARIRSIKPEFWASEQTGECSSNARLLFIGIWNFADDRGVYPEKPKQLKAHVFPFDDITGPQVSGWIGELLRVGLLRRIEDKGILYLVVTGWKTHQKIDRPQKKWVYPNPEDFPEQFDEGSSSAQRVLALESSRVEGNGKEGSSKSRAGARDSGGGLANGHENNGSGIPTDVHPAWKRTADAVLAEFGNSPNLLNIGQIDCWLRAGADLDADILPAMRSVIGRERKTDPGWEPRSLSYFNGAIADAIASRNRPLQAGTVRRRGLSDNEAEAILSKLDAERGAA